MSSSLVDTRPASRCIGFLTSFRLLTVLACMLAFGLCEPETYTDEGLSYWVVGPLHVSEWLLNQNAVVMTAAFIPIFALGLVFYTFELGVMSPVLLLIAAITLWFLIRSSKTKAM